MVVIEDKIAEELVESPSFLQKVVGSIVGFITGEKAQFEDAEWSGSASNWETAAAYCSDCLIDENEGEKTKEKCHLPYRRPGSTKINKNALKAIASGGRGITALKGVSAESKKKAANRLIGWWPQAFDKNAPASIYRLAGKERPEDKAGSGWQFYRTKDGKLWFLGIYSNKYKDKDEDILSSESHNEFAEWMNESGFQPALIVNHLPRAEGDFWYKAFEQFGDNIEILNKIVRTIFDDTAFAFAERAIYVNGFAMLAGQVRPEREEFALKLASTGPHKMSHGFLSFAPSFWMEEKSANIIDRYRLFEASILIGRNPANDLTRGVVEVGKDMVKFKDLSDEDRRVLSLFMDEDQVTDFEGTLGNAEELFDKVLNFKDEKEEEETTDDAEDVEATEEEDEGVEEESAEDPAEGSEDKSESEDEPPMFTKEQLEYLGEQFNLSGLNALLTKMAAKLDALEGVPDQLEALKDLRQRVEAIGKSQDEQVAEEIWMAPTWGGGFSPSKEASTELPEGEARTKAEENGNPGGSGASADNPLAFAFWDLVGRGTG